MSPSITATATLGRAPVPSSLRTENRPQIKLQPSDRKGTWIAAWVQGGRSAFDEVRSSTLVQRHRGDASLADRDWQRREREFTQKYMWDFIAENPAAYKENEVYFPVLNWWLVNKTYDG